jgi:hypothetical protein
MHEASIAVVAIAAVVVGGCAAAPVATVPVGREAAGSGDDASRDAVWAELSDPVPSAVEPRSPPRPSIDSARATAIAGDIAAHADATRGVYVLLSSSWGVMTTCGHVFARRRACSPAKLEIVARAVTESVSPYGEWECGAGVCRVPIVDCARAYCALTPDACREHPPSGGVYGEGTLAVLLEGTSAAPTVTAVAFECTGWLDLAAEEAAAPSCDDAASWR